MRLSVESVTLATAFLMEMVEDLGADMTNKSMDLASEFASRCGWVLPPGPFTLEVAAQTGNWPVTIDVLEFLAAAQELAEDGRPWGEVVATMYLWDPT